MRCRSSSVVRSRTCATVCFSIVGSSGECSIRDSGGSQLCEVPRLGRCRRSFPSARTWRSTARWRDGTAVLPASPNVAFRSNTARPRIFTADATECRPVRWRCRCSPTSARTPSTSPTTIQPNSKSRRFCRSLPQPAGQRRTGHCRRHGRQYSAAQPRRGVRSGCALAAEPWRHGR